MALGKLFPVGFAVIDADNDRNWHWFLEILHSVIERAAPEFIDPTNLKKQLTILSDRQKGLLDGVVSVFPPSVHRYCLKHLEWNFRNKFKHPALCSLLWKAVKATTKEEYNEAIANMTGINPETETWLEQHAPTIPSIPTGNKPLGFITSFLCGGTAISAGLN